MGFGLGKNTLYPTALSCSYCEGTMLFTVRKVTRPVPHGAKDLNLYDEVERWECQVCNQVSTKFITSCNTCGSKVLNFEEHGDEGTYRYKLSPDLHDTLSYPPENPKIFGYLRKQGVFGTEKYPEQCLNCVTCDVCKQRIYDASSEAQVFSYITAITEETMYTYFFFHERCVENSPLYKSYKDDLQELQKASNKKGCVGSLIIIAVLFGILLTSLVAAVSAASLSNTH